MTKQETLAKLIKELEDVQRQQEDVLNRMDAIIKKTAKAGAVKDIADLKKKLLNL
jgi:hypothetical protein